MTALLLLRGPVSGGYAGKIPTLFFAAFGVFLYAVFLLNIYKRRRDPKRKIDSGAIIFTSVIMAFLVGMALWDVWRYG